jgi:hypothetical protein
VIAALNGNGPASSLAASVGVFSTTNATYIQVGSGIDAVVIPGAGGVCFAAVLPPLLAQPQTGTQTGPQSIGMACDPAAWVDQHGIGQEVIASSGSASEMIGVVPDGNATVQIGNDNGASTAVPVVSNIFYVRSTTPIGRITFDTAAGVGTTMGG